MIYQDLLDAQALDQYAAALNSRAGRTGAKGRLTAVGLRDRILGSGGRCEWCGLDLLNAEFELDHVLSLRQGGANVAANLAVACPDCNRRKGRKHPARFAAEIYRESGLETELIARLFARHGIGATQQLALFGEGARAASASVDVAVELNEIPPYRWTS